MVYLEERSSRDLGQGRTGEMGAAGDLAARRHFRARPSRRKGTADMRSLLPPALLAASFLTLAACHGSGTGGRGETKPPAENWTALVNVNAASAAQIVAALQAQAGSAVNAGVAQSFSTTEEETRVKLGATRLQYFDGDKSLILYTEAAEDKKGYYYIVYVPSPERWIRTMPEWARSRRTEILIDIKRLTQDERIKWVDHP